MVADTAVGDFWRVVRAFVILSLSKNDCYDCGVLAADFGEGSHLAGRFA